MAKHVGADTFELCVMICILFSEFVGLCTEIMTVYVVRGRLCLCWPRDMAI